MDFERELDLALAPELPHRSRVIEVSARHLGMIAEVNDHMNLTRIAGAREAVVKHVVDSLSPWRLFFGAKMVMDAGTGAGFPGIPLAAALPDTRFLLVDSTQKKARFVETVVSELALENVEVAGDRAEDLLRRVRCDLITARAVAPVERALGYFASALRQGAQAVLYKGPDVESELKDAGTEAKRRRVRMEIVMRYELPDALGSRAVVRISPL